MDRPLVTQTVSEARRFQFSLRALFVLVSLAGMGLAFGVLGISLTVIASLTGYFLATRQRRFAFATVVLFLLLSCSGAVSTVQVRLDTGDQRLCFWGIPVLYGPMRADRRNALLSLSDAKVPRRWIWCAQQVGSNNAAGMVRSFYCEAAAWVDEDRDIAKLVLQDLADYVQTTHALQGLPRCTVMLWHDVVERDEERFKIAASWRSNHEVQQYLSSKKYRPR